VPVLGITGGIASGKTLFTECLSSYCPSLRVFDADRCARELTASDPAILAGIRDYFGSGVFDASGALQRSSLRGIVFSDPQKRKALEAILHPAIRRAWLDLARAVREEPGSPWLAVDIPLLFETAAEIHFDHIVVVACSAHTQRRRLMEKRHIPPALADSMIAAQLPLVTKIHRANTVVWNDGLTQGIQSQAALFAQTLLS
jgi:dephospho-CoA kinase